MYKGIPFFTGLFDIKGSNFLGGTNVHNLIIIGLLGFAAYKLK